MFQVEFTAEEQAKINAIEEEQASLEEKRNADAAVAYKKALAAVGWDKRRLVVHTMPDGFGGAVIHKIPSYESWALLDKRILKSLTSDGKKDDYAVAVGSLLENDKLLEHPSVSELQQWRDELPGLYGQIKGTLDARLEHGNYAGKSRTSKSKQGEAPKPSQS